MNLDRSRLKETEQHLFEDGLGDDALETRLGREDQLDAGKTIINA